MNLYNKLVEIDRNGVYLNYFWHQEDKVTLTSKGYLWAYPGVICDNAITVLPEQNMKMSKEDVKDYLDPQKTILSRKQTGGTAPSQVKKEIKKAKLTLERRK